MISDFPAVCDTSASRVCPARDEAVSALPETMSLYLADTAHAALSVHVFDCREGW
jgi:hypothetical protein